MSAVQVGAAASLPVVVSLFDTATPNGPAMGRERRTTWGELTGRLLRRREGAKDGANFVPARFTPEPCGRVRRVGARLAARTMVALDVEANKATGEVPPPFEAAVAAVRAKGWAGAVYTSHSHTPATPRYRVVLPLAHEIAHDLPVPEVCAAELGLAGVLDTGKLGAASLFYLPSAAPGALAGHRAEVIEGVPVPAEWARDRAGALHAAREVEQERERRAAMQEAAERRRERIARGHDPDSPLIERVRDHLDLEAELGAHGYEPAGGGRYLFPGSETGTAGVRVMRGRDGVERVYSHHAADPLAPGNLPSWCRVKALDAVDVATILDFGGDRTAALRTLAQRFGLNRPKSGGPLGPTPGAVAEPRAAAPVTPSKAEDGEATIEALQEPGPTRRTLRMLTPAECAAAPPRGYIVKGLIAPRDVVCVFGPPGAGKSVLVPHLAYAVAQGREAFGRRTRQGLAFYVPAEDPHGMRSRVSALRLAHGDAPDMRVIEGVSDLFALDSPDPEALRELVREHRPALVVLDTVAVAFPAMDENTSHDMGRVVAYARSLTEWGAAVVLVHHDTKAQDGTPRGHSILNGALDVALRLAPADDAGVIRGKLSKNRNGPCDVVLAFRIGASELSTDEDGDSITAPVAAELAEAGERRAKLAPTEAAALDVLREMVRLEGQAQPDGELAVPEGAWRDECDNRRVSTSDSPKNRRDVMSRAYAGLLRKGLVQAGGGLVWLPGEGAELGTLDAATAATGAIVARLSLQSQPAKRDGGGDDCDGCFRPVASRAPAMPEGGGLEPENPSSRHGRLGRCEAMPEEAAPPSVETTKPVPRPLPGLPGGPSIPTPPSGTPMKPWPASYGETLR